MNIAQSAASFVGTSPKAAVKAASVAAEARLNAAAPKSRKPTAALSQKAMAPATPSIVASLAAQIAEAPKAAPAPKASKTPTTLLYIAKTFKPRTDQLVDRKAEGKGNFAQLHNWQALESAVVANGGQISYDAAVAAVLAAGKAGGYEKTCNARGFVQGRVRNGHLRAV